MQQLKPILTKQAMPTTLSIAAGIAGLVLSYFLVSASIQYFSKPARYLKTQPLVGQPVNQRWFPKTRASIRSLFHGRSMILEGYQQYSKNDRIFALPQLGGDPWAIIPPTKIPELLRKRDGEEIDHQPVIFDIVAMYWTGDRDITSVSKPHLNGNVKSL